MHFFFVAKQFDIRSIQACENVPIDIFDVVTRHIVAVVREFGAVPSFTCEMLSTTVNGQSTQWIQTQTLQSRQDGIVEQGSKPSLRIGRCHGFQQAIIRQAKFRLGIHTSSTA